MSTAQKQGSWTVRVERFDERVSLYEVRLSEYHEHMFVALGDKMISITMMDATNPYFREPQTFTFARPHDWDTELEGDEALIQVWQAVGVQR